MDRKHWAILAVGLMLALPAGLGAREAANAPAPVAQVKERIVTDRLEIRVYQGAKLVQLRIYTELYVVTPLSASRSEIENLVNKSVAIVRSQRKPGRWEVYQDVWIGAGRDLTLSDNVFKVKQVFTSSVHNPIELRLDEKVVRLEPGEALLVL